MRTMKINRNLNTNKFVWTESKFREFAEKEVDRLKKDIKKHKEHREYFISKGAPSRNVDYIVEAMEFNLDRLEKILAMEHIPENTQLFLDPKDNPVHQKHWYGNPNDACNENPSSADSVVSSMHKAVDNGTARIPYSKRVGNWRYELDENYILHIIYHATEVVTADFGNKEILKVTSGEWNSVSTHSGITKTVRALEGLGYTMEGDMKDYEYEKRGFVRNSGRVEPISRVSGVNSRDKGEALKHLSRDETEKFANLLGKLLDISKETEEENDIHSRLTDEEEKLVYKLKTIGFIK